MARKRVIRNMPLGYGRDRPTRTKAPLRQRPGCSDMDVIMVGGRNDGLEERWELAFPGSTTKVNALEG